MSDEHSFVRVAVIGAGVMGGQIAALLANVGCQVDLREPDMNGDDGENRAAAAVKRLLAAKPAAFFTPQMAQRVHPGGFNDLSSLGEADWIIEAVVEDLEAKRSLHSCIENAASSQAVISSNTSGLSIASLASGRSAAYRRPFSGVHFFNPPRHMKLVEIIPGSDTDDEVVARLAGFIEKELGKGVVCCRDTPNFIANRLGVFAIMDVLHRMEQKGLSVEEADAVTGELIGRPKSATLRLCDLIGLDTLAQVARTASEMLTDVEYDGVFDCPAYVQTMLEKELIGEKRKGGFYRKIGSEIEVLRLEDMTYGKRARVSFEDNLKVASTSAKLSERLDRLWADDGLLAQFARDHLTATLAYAAHIGPDVAGDVNQIDSAMTLGFNWELGPFEMMDMLGVERITTKLESAGRTVPALLRRRGDFYTADGEALDYVTGHHVRIARRLDDGDLLGQSRVIDECDGARLLGFDDLGIILLSGRMNVVGPATLDLIRESLEDAAFSGFVLYGDGGLFSAGANLNYVASLIDDTDWKSLERYVQGFQQATMAVRNSAVPVVAAARGFALGGGCELCLSAARRVTAVELQMGLVEAKVGLIPGAGGCKEMVRRHGAQIAPVFEVLSEGTFSDNAHVAREQGFLDRDDAIKMDGGRILGVAVESARTLAAQGYRVPAELPLQLAGRDLLSQLEDSLSSRCEAGEISVHDQLVGASLGQVLCGVGIGSVGDDGEVAASESDLLDLEREVFLRLCSEEATRERIAHMLQTGKPLRN